MLCVAVLEARQDRVDNVGITAKGPPIVKLALPEFRPTMSGDRADKLACDPGALIGVLAHDFPRHGDVDALQHALGVDFRRREGAW